MSELFITKKTKKKTLALVLLRKQESNLETQQGCFYSIMNQILTFKLKIYNRQIPNN